MSNLANLVQNTLVYVKVTKDIAVVISLNVKALVFHEKLWSMKILHQHDQEWIITLSKCMWKLSSSAGILKLKSQNGGITQNAQPN